MSKKQKIIPAITIPDFFNTISGKELRVFILNYVRTELSGNPAC